MLPRYHSDQNGYMQALPIMDPIRNHSRDGTLKSDKDRDLQDYRQVWTDMRCF